LNFNSQLNKAVFITALLLTSFISLNAQNVFIQEGLINPKTVKKIELIGNELKEKTDVTLHLYANETINGKTMIEYREEIRKNYNKSYIILLFAQKEQKVEIISSLNLKTKFNKEDILDPFSGTIIPLLITKPKKDAIDDRAGAAMLNGYADIAEQVASSFDIELNNAIGNSNRNIINTIRVIFYVAIVFILILYIRKKFARKKQ